MVTLVAACGAASAASPNKPTARGTPVNGAYQFFAAATPYAAAPYAAALDTIAELGFRLADPCYERQSPETLVAWHPMGQGQSYAATHALIVVLSPTRQNLGREPSPCPDFSTEESG